MKIYIAKNGQQHGPFEMEELRSKVTESAFSPSDLAWMKGWPAWQPLSDISELELPPAPPPTVVTAAPANIAFSNTPPGTKRDIDSLDVAPIWKQRFHLMEKIGWDQGIQKNYWNLGQLDSSERSLIRLNLWAVVFGPAYYLLKGMWLKFTILLVAYFILLALGVVPVFLVHVYCVFMANYDYYLFKVYGKPLF